MTSSPASQAPTSADVGDRRPRAAPVDVDDEPLLARRRRRSASTTVAAAQDEQRSAPRELVEQRVGHVEHPLERGDWLTRSSGSWLRSVPLARFTQVKPAGLEARWRPSRRR